MSLFDTVYNLIVLFFWFRAWSAYDRDSFFNPFVLALRTWTDRALDVVRVLCFGLPHRGCAIVAVILLLALRAAGYYFNWPGFVGAAFRAGAPEAGGFETRLMLMAAAGSLLSLGFFLFNLWGVSVLYARNRRFSVFSRADGLADQVCRPFSLLPPLARPPVLLLFGMGLSVTLDLAARGVAADVPLTTMVLRSLILTLVRWVNLLPLVASFLMLFVIGTWIGNFAGSHSIGAFCHEWLDFFLGPLRRYPIRLGMFDVTPVVAFFALNWAAKGLLLLLQWSAHFLTLP